MNYKILLISILTFCILIVMGNFRWEYRESDEIFTYKYDRWTKQLWVEFTPEIGTNDITDIPLVYVDKLTTKELEPYLMKLGVTGQGVKKWVFRTRASDVYIGMLIANVTTILFSCFKAYVQYIRRRHNKVS
ncbi:hypothetical protein MKZ24_14695 [Paenibacillus sp. FSL R7-0297]|uniref:hypothetical protein n=1 Tax=unclassified Paenibacillus TaxID=185978 RepID=UPI0004F5CDBE|nr:hypothetical protein [Paenibacillus sp. FSL R5-0912]AIQ42761.1 hypothetical protein R50912_23985 [Paenibacillus sp. FSL R5-0912]